MNLNGKPIVGIVGLGEMGTHHAQNFAALDVDLVAGSDVVTFVDRIEDGLATLEVDGSDDLYDLAVDAGALPEEGRHQDAILQIEVEATYDEAATAERKEDAQRRFDRLSERRSDSE